LAGNLQQNAPKINLFQGAGLDHLTEDNLTQDSHMQALARQIHKAMKHYQVPGVGLGILCGEMELTAGFGFTSIENPLPVNADTLFQIGSITKTFTGTAVMRLVEMGKLDLDTPIRHWMPLLNLEDEEVASKVTLRHLLTHSGGWMGDYFDDLGWGDDALAAIVGRMSSLPQLTPLGQVYSYNNAGFYIAGRLIEIATGQTYERAIKELILDPLGLEMSFFFPDDVMLHRFVVGHQIESGVLKICRPWAIGRAGHPVGGLVSNVKDLLCYARFQLGDGGLPGGERLLNAETMAKMQEPHIAVGRVGEQVGLTWMIHETGGQKIVGHGGATNGQSARLSIVPAAQFAMVILANADRGDELIRDISRWIYRAYLNLEEPEATLLKLTKEQLRLYAGKYSSLMQDIILKPHAGGLMMELIPKGGFPTRESPPSPASAPVRLAFSSPDRIVALDEPMKDSAGDFLYHPDGSVAWFRFGGRVHIRID
jgi:CubicO group peptidase (beta-lactamase class C family)